MRITFALLVSLSFLCCGGTFAAEVPAAKPPTNQSQDLAQKAASSESEFAGSDVGRRALRGRSEAGAHLWKAQSPTPTPLLFFIHGGGWQAGNRNSVGKLSAGNAHSRASPSSPSSIGSSRRHTQRLAKPPVAWPLHDAARALQFVRSKAAEWNIDKQRIGTAVRREPVRACGWHFTATWQTPRAATPWRRESTRLWCAAVTVAQTTLDPQQMKEWTPNSRYGGHAFGIFKQVNGKDVMDFEQFLAQRERILPWIQEYSPYALVSAGAPPIYLFYGTPPALGKEQKDPTHTSNFGVKLQEKCKSVGPQCELVYPGAPDVKHPTVESYLIERLKAPKP